MIVADTNLIAYLLIEGEFTPRAERVYQDDNSWAAPYLWRSEFRNILASYLRKEYLSIAEAKLKMQIAERILAGKEFELKSDSILDLAMQSGLSARNCEYVLLAQRLEIKLVTNDRKVRRSFPEITIDLASY